MNLEVKKQRDYERSIKKKGVEAIRKVRDFFIRPELSHTSECEHLATTKRFNISPELIEERCYQCGKLLKRYPIERGETQDHKKNITLLEALTRKQRR